MAERICEVDWEVIDMIGAGLIAPRVGEIGIGSYAVGG